MTYRIWRKAVWAVALAAVLLFLAGCQEAVTGRSPAPAPDPDPDPPPVDEPGKYNPPVPPGPTVTGAASGTLSVPGAAILSGGELRTDAAPTEDATLMAVEVDGHVYLYHPDLGDVQLSEETSELAVQYAIYGGAPGARATTLQPAAATERAPGRYYRKTATGMNVRLSRSSPTDHYTFENTTVLWHAVVSAAETQRIYFAPKSIFGGNLFRGDFYLERREARDVQVDGNDVELYRDMLRGSFSAATLVATPAAILKFRKALEDGADRQVFIDMVPIVIVEELKEALTQLAGLLPFDQCLDIIIDPLLEVAESNLIAMLTNENHRIVSFTDALLESLPVNAVLCTARIAAAAGTGLTSEVVLEVVEKVFLLKWAANEVLIGYDSVKYDAYATVPGLAQPTKMYWTDYETDRIERANLDGTGREALITTGLDGPVGIAIHGGKMYWVEQGTDRIERANLDGTGREALITTGLDRPVGIAIHGGRMYWADWEANRIERANLDGSDRRVLVRSESPNGIAIHGGKMYWTERQEGGRIERANLNGTGREVLITVDHPGLIAIHGGKMYWTDRVDRIERANLNGTGREALITGLDRPAGIAIAP